MASCSGNGSRGHHKFTLNVNETYVSGGADNYSTVSWSLVLSPIQTGWDWNYTNAVGYKVTINGTEYTGTINQYNGSSTVTVRSGTQNITHNSDGSKTANFSFSVWDNVSASYLPGSASGNGSITLTNIPRYTTITSFTVSKRNETSVTYNFTTADTCDYVWYSKDNGSSWTGVNITDGTSASFNVGSLNPNTTYKFKLRVRRKDSQLTTDSSTVQQTTYKAPTQSLNNKTETRIVMNWSIDSTADHIWYSLYSGTSWVDAGSVNATSGTVTINNLEPNHIYNVSLRIRRSASQTTYDIPATSVTTYAAPTQSLNSKTETTIKMNWSADSKISKVEYSTNNGSSWTTVTNDANATSGNYTISSLTANTSYNIKTRLTRKATSTNYATSKSTILTYNYPYVSEVGTSALTIGNSQTLTLYNPLSRSCTVYMKQNNTSGTQLYSGTTSGTSITFTPTASSLYASIPNAQSGTAVYYCVYSSQTVSTKSGTYKIKGNETPTFTNFTYRDTNATVTGITGDDQIIVRNLSRLEVAISSANKMVAKNSATGKNYSIIIANVGSSVNYDTQDVTKNLGIINASGTQKLSVTAYDSRSLNTNVSKDVLIYDYSKPVINASITRLNNFESETTIQVAGTYSRLTIENVDKNTVTSVKYRYRETGGTWGSWTNFTTTVSNGAYSCTDVTLNLDNSKSFEFEIQVIDTLHEATTNTYKIDEGQAVFFISSNQKKCFINGDEVVPAKYIKGKNLFDKNKRFKSGNLYQQASNIIQITANSASDINVVEVQEGLTYTLSSNVSRQWTLATASQLPFTFLKITGQIITQTGTSCSITIPTGHKYLYIKHYPDNGEDNINQNVQVEQGTVATSFEEYVDKKILLKNDNNVWEDFYKEKKDAVRTGNLTLSSYIGNTVDYKTWTRTGNVVNVSFRGQLVNSIPNNAEILYLPFTNINPTEVMIFIGGRYSRDSNLLGSVGNGKTIRVSSYSQTDKYAHIEFTYITDDP